jgi:hypothetical protein
VDDEEIVMVRRSSGAAEEPASVGLTPFHGYKIVTGGKLLDEQGISLCISKCQCNGKVPSIREQFTDWLLWIMLLIDQHFIHNAIDLNVHGRHPCI